MIRHPASRPLLLWLAAAALLLRLLVPAGFMPGAGGTLVLCTGNGVVTVAADAAGHPVKAPMATDSGSSCAFAGLGITGPLPELPALPLPLLTALAVLLLATGLRLGVGLGQPPRPSTGPPLKI